MEPAAIRKYLKTYAEKDDRPLCCGSLAGIERVVVIPALAERKSLFNTILSLAENPPEELQRTLVLCVINNRPYGIADSADIADNRETLRILMDVIAGRIPDEISPEHDIRRMNTMIRANGLRLSCLDASSEGREMPAKNGGVGMARKIGMDRALSILDYSSGKEQLLYCLDADTLVEKNYLLETQNYFSTNRTVAAVVSYAHQEATDDRLRAAACCYEIFLRYYVMGLSYAVSPYAFHTIGSTMICSAEAYASVRGMVRRDAAEDFYFLNKLAKIGKVGHITATKVYPSSRVSTRVPFGTGRRMIRYREGDHDEYRFYNPAIFLILKRWLQEMTEHPDRSPEQIRRSAGDISPLLADYLETSSFYESWEKIKANSGNGNTLKRQFHIWFDAFRTLKFVHYLTEKGIARIPMCDALDRLLKLSQKKSPVPKHEQAIPPAEIQRAILDYLRNDICRR